MEKSMAEFPYMPLWTDAYLADCGHLSDAENGRYLTLLMAIWRAPHQRLPNDDKWLARRFSRTEDQVQNELRPLIEEFCQNDGNWITQKRLTKEWKRVTKTHERQSASAKSRWMKEKTISHGNAERHESGNATISISRTIEDKKEEDTPSGSANGNFVAGSNYAFECGIIKLNQKNFDQWQAAFSELDLRSELTALAGWDKLTKAGWFVAVANALAKKNREAIAQKAAIRIGIENGMKPPTKRYFRV